MQGLKDIARRAGVSVATVSQILNGRGDFAATTVEKVIEAAKSCGYTNVKSKSWSNRRTIGVVIPDISDPYYTSVVKLIGHFLEKEGYSVILFDTDNLVNKEREMIKTASRQAKGVIFCPSPGSDFFLLDSLGHNTCVPLVCFNTTVSSGQISYVTVDNFNGAKMAVHYLISRGRRKIAYLRGNFDRDRFAGYLAALKESGLPFLEELVVDSGYTHHGGYTGVFHLLSNKVEFDGIFACNDLAAFGAIECLKSRGIGVPGDVSIIGFDDIWFASIYTPKLTTVRQPLYEMCKSAVNILLRSFENGDSVERKIVQPQLIVRDSA